MSKTLLVNDTWTKMKKKKVSYALMFPYLLFFSIFTLTPVLIAISLSLTSFNILEPPQWIGFENYIQLLLSDSIFMISLKNTFILAAITGPASFFLCLLIAWFINELSPKMRAFVTLVFYAPSISGNVYLIWTMLFSGDSYGYLNSILIKTGLIATPIVWLKDTTYIMPIVIIVSLWLSLGVSFLAFIAGFQGVDKTYYEAGAIDGINNRWQELWFITLPLMKPQLFFSAVMSIAGSFGMGEVVTALAGFPSTDYAAHTIMNHLTDYGLGRFEMGYASAIATLLFVVIVLTNLAARVLIEKVGE